MSESNTVEVDRELLAKATLKLREYAESLRRQGNSNAADEYQELADSLTPHTRDADKHR